MLKKRGKTGESGKEWKRRKERKQEIVGEKNLTQGLNQGRSFREGQTFLEEVSYGDKLSPAGGLADLSLKNSFHILTT